ncbi:hypothetical protein QAD02_004234 [Eretmocerus hayati]|uniref:Uncharacterized protein n=1 Tax=Eretmocerus hayati TaxID=131215 RepID=A0ACC2NQ18_9HYME|nr:hypothetical protein QAD02_004234 [Eretmocerus hayati]
MVAAVKAAKPEEDEVGDIRDGMDRCRLVFPFGGKVAITVSPEYRLGYSYRKKSLVASGVTHSVMTASDNSITTIVVQCISTDCAKVTSRYGVFHLITALQLTKSLFREVKVLLQYPAVTVHPKAIVLATSEIEAAELDVCFSVETPRTELPNQALVNQSQSSLLIH